MDPNIIEIRKKYSKLINESKRQAKQEKCLWCGKKITRFCNSHSVPRCVLDNIDTDGKVDYFNAIVNIPFINNDKGLNEAGTFKLLCPTCDGKIFQDYENLEALKEVPSERMLEEIALKNVLLMLNKRYTEIELYNNLLKESKIPYPFDKKQEVNSLDERDYFWDFNRIKEIMKENGEKCEFKLFYCKHLDYTVPIAFQGAITLYGDLKGNIVTDIYNTSEEVIVKHMHICVFPWGIDPQTFARDKEKHILVSDLIYCCLTYDLFGGITFKRKKVKEKQLIQEKKEKANRLEKELEDVQEEFQKLQEAMEYFDSIFEVGTNIRHKRYGLGTITARSDNIIEVAFIKGEKKKFGMIVSIINSIIRPQGVDCTEQMKKNIDILKRKTAIKSAVSYAEKNLSEYTEYLD